MKNFAFGLFCLAFFLSGTPSWSFSGNSGIHTNTTVASSGREFHLVAGQCKSGADEWECLDNLNDRKRNAEVFTGGWMNACNNDNADVSDEGGNGRGSNSYRDCVANVKSTIKEKVDRANDLYKICLSKC